MKPSTGNDDYDGYIDEEQFLSLKVGDKLKRGSKGRVRIVKELSGPSEDRELSMTMGGKFAISIVNHSFLWADSYRHYMKVD